MFQKLIKVVIICALATSALSKPLFIRNPVAPSPVAPLENGTIALPPSSDGKVTYRQATRDTIISRKASRAASRGHALQPRQSARVYPTCESSSGPEYIPQSGFVNFPDYALDAASAILIEGTFTGVSPEIACVMLCETTSGCTAGNWYGGNLCVLRKGTITGSNFLPRPNTDRVAFIRGDCASLEGQINNSTIMEACCNNPAPSTIRRCSPDIYKNLGNYCIQTRNSYTTANQVASLQVAGGNDGTAVLKNCLARCTSFSASGRTSNGAGCTAAAASSQNEDGSTKTEGNCILYGGRPTTMVAQQGNPYTITGFAGTCEQLDANGIQRSQAGAGCYSPQTGP